MTKKCLVLLAVLMLSFCSLLLAQPVLSSLAASLMSSDEDTRNKGYQDALEARRQQIQDVVTVLETSTDNSHNGSRVIAARLLGELNAVEAIGALSKNLLFINEPNWFGSHPTFPEEEHPCAMALIEIGYPSIEPMMNRIAFQIARPGNEKKLEPEERQMAAWVIFKIVGKEDAIAKLNRRAEQLGSGSKARFTEAADYIRNYKPLRVDPVIIWKASREKTAPTVKANSAPIS